MKFDIQKNIALQSDQQATFMEELLELPVRFKATASMYWQQYLLRYAIKSERRTLARLTDLELQDIGITRADAMAESKRNFSDLPDNRLD